MLPRQKTVTREREKKTKQRINSQKNNQKKKGVAKEEIHNFSPLFPIKSKRPKKKQQKASHASGGKKGKKKERGKRLGLSRKI